MRLSPVVRKLFPLMFIVSLSLTALPGPRAVEDARDEKWKGWIGKKVNIKYECCGQSACVQIRGAKLKDVTDKVVVIVIEGSQHLIPKHMIKLVEVCK